MALALCLKEVAQLGLLRQSHLVAPHSVCTIVFCLSELGRSPVWSTVQKTQDMSTIGIAPLGGNLHTVFSLAPAVKILPPDCCSPDFQLTPVFEGTFPPCLMKSTPGTLTELSKSTCNCRSATGGGQVSRMTCSASKSQAQREECGMECGGRGIFLDFYHPLH